MKFCINRDHKISFKIISIPFGEALDLNFLYIWLFLSCSLVYGYISSLMVGESDALSLEGFSFAIVVVYLSIFSLNWKESLHCAIICVSSQG